MEYVLRVWSLCSCSLPLCLPVFLGWVIGHVLPTMLCPWPCLTSPFPLLLGGHWCALPSQSIASSAEGGSHCNCLPSLCGALSASMKQVGGEYICSLSTGQDSSYPSLGWQRQGVFSKNLTQASHSPQIQKANAFQSGGGNFLEVILSLELAVSW